jgi:hypothetical protein
MGDAGNREKGMGYFARRIWHGPDETCWHVWLEAPPTHQFRKGRGAAVTFVQLHGTGTRQIVRIIPHVDEQYMTDRALLKLYSSPEPEQTMGFGLACSVALLRLPLFRPVFRIGKASDGVRTCAPSFQLLS